MGSRVETRRFQAMGQMDSTCTAPPSSGEATITANDTTATAIHPPPPSPLLLGLIILIACL
jgi:hypothetical protein